ncbi:thrombomodulin-like [Nematolebias whitei]|uniref:thrombomodulin-like n=1 Tax=Nematolebias whitei TaxID=451745 RepID=UPI00189A1A34|nr:thrombomodulin-like [Nematolebias whitei]
MDPAATQTVLVFVFCLCGLQEAAPPQLGRCSGGLCFFQHSVDFGGAQRSCVNSSGRLVESGSEDQMEFSSLLAGSSGRFWLRSAEGANCTAASVRGGEVVAAAVPCRDKLDGFACHYNPAVMCGSLSGDAQYTLSMAAHFQLLGSDSFPPGTVARVGVAQHLDSKHLCYGGWFRAPWSCEVFRGGCEHDCDSNTHTCTCPTTHALHQDGFSCVPKSQLDGCEDGFEHAEDGWSCEDVDECEEDTCTAEGEECVNLPGGYQCTCAHGFAEDDGTCVNTSICKTCEQRCSKVGGAYRCECVEGFTVAPEDPTKCRQQCPGRVCPARCIHDPELEEKNMQQCTCPEGYIVDISNRTASCVDIDECESQDMCDHMCENTFGNYRCACEDGFQLVRGDRCVPLVAQDEDSSGSPPPPGHPPHAPGSLQPAVLPAYIRTGSILGITVFLVLCVVLLVCLVQSLTRRCGSLDLTSIKHPDMDIFYLQQVSTETYKRLSFDRQSRTDSLRL